MTIIKLCAVFLGMSKFFREESISPSGAEQSNVYRSLQTL